MLKSVGKTKSRGEVGAIMVMFDGYTKNGLKKYLHLAAVIVVSALLVVENLSAQQLKVYTEPLAPVHYEEGGKIVGIATEVVEEIFKEAGFEAEIELYPWKRAYQKVLGDSGTFIYTINRTEKREPLFKWIGPILSKKTYLYKLKSRKDVEVVNYDDAKKYTTVVILGHSLTSRLLDLGFREGRELITTPNKEAQIKVFLKGRADLITGNQYTIYRSLKSEGYSIHDVEPALFISSKGYYIGANKNTQDEIVEKLRIANDKVQGSGKVEQIINKYIN